MKKYIPPVLACNINDKVVYNFSVIMSERFMKAFNEYYYITFHILESSTESFIIFKGLHRVVLSLSLAILN